MAAEGKVNARKLVQTIAHHLAFRKRINSILTATNQEQLTYIVLTVSGWNPGAQGEHLSIQLLEPTAQLLLTSISPIFLEDGFLFLLLV